MKIKKANPISTPSPLATRSFTLKALQGKKNFKPSVPDAMIRPVFAKPGGRLVKYMIEDNFLAFWFRFVYKYRSAIEINNLEYVKQIVKRDFETYSGPYLEKFFREVLSGRKQYNIIGRHWDRKGEKELDIVAVNQTEKKALIAEVKRNKEKINIQELRTKARILEHKLSSFRIGFRGLSLEDVFLNDEKE